MIGLGSNRLSVCRRGGMSVTQAGKGGMEWLLGGRGALGASPYSEQATAALKAQFPTQWPTIRDYGFAHPEIVGYMNAYAPEDAKIAISLVPTLGIIRWNNNNGSAYVKTTVKPSDYSDIYGEITWIRHQAYGWDTLFGVQENNSGARNAMFWLYANNFHIRWGNIEGVNVATGVAVGTGIHRAQASVATGVILDGRVVSTPSSAPWATRYMHIFKGSLTSSEHINASFKEAKIGGSINSIDHWYIPFKKNGVMEILDVIGGEIQERTGTFTEAFTLQDGVTPWTFPS